MSEKFKELKRIREILKAERDLVISTLAEDNIDKLVLIDAKLESIDKAIGEVENSGPSVYETRGILSV